MTFGTKGLAAAISLYLLTIKARFLTLAFFDFNKLRDFFRRLKKAKTD